MNDAAEIERLTARVAELTAHRARAYELLGHETRRAGCPDWWRVPRSAQEQRNRDLVQARLALNTEQQRLGYWQQVVAGLEGFIRCQPIPLRPIRTVAAVTQPTQEDPNA